MVSDKKNMILLVVFKLLKKLDVKIFRRKGLSHVFKYFLWNGLKKRRHKNHVFNKLVYITIKVA